MKRILFLSIFCFVLLSAAQAESASTLKTLKVFSDEKQNLLQFRFSFDSPLKGRLTSSSHGDSFRVTLHDAITTPPTRSFSVKDNIIQSVRAVQINKNTLRLEFFLKKKNADISNALTRMIKGNELSLSLNKQKLFATAAPTPYKQKQQTAETRHAEVSSLYAKKNATSENGMSDSLLGNISTIASMMGGDHKAGSLFVKDAEAAEQKERPGMAVPDIYSSTLKMVLVLSIILVLLYGVLKLLKKKGVGAGGTLFGGKGKSLKILERTFLDNKKSIAIAEICGEVVVIGVTEQSVNLITKLTGEKAEPFLSPDPAGTRAGKKKNFRTPDSIRGKKEDAAIKNPSKIENLISQVSSRITGKNEEQTPFTSLLKKQMEVPEQEETEETPRQGKPSMLEEINRERDEERARKVIAMMKRAQSQTVTSKQAEKKKVQPVVSATSPSAPVQQDKAERVAPAGKGSASSEKASSTPVSSMKQRRSQVHPLLEKEATKQAVTAPPETVATSMNDIEAAYFQRKQKLKAI